MSPGGDRGQRPSNRFLRLLIRSETAEKLLLLFRELPPRRLRLLGIVMLSSLLLGVIDLLQLGILARFVGLLAGGKLADHFHGIHFFGGRSVDQLGWLILLLILASWISSALRFGAALLQSHLTAVIWVDFAEKAYSNLLLQHYEFFKRARTAHLAERFNRILNKISDYVVLPLVGICGSVLSSFVLLTGVVFILGIKAVVLFAFILAAYVIASRVITPYMRMAARQRLRYLRRINMLMVESVRSIRDIQLYSAEATFSARFAADGAAGRRYDRASKLLADVPGLVVEPLALTVVFLLAFLPILTGASMHELRSSVPFLASIVFALLRISGSLRKVFGGINKLRGGLPELDDALDLLRMPSDRLTLFSPGVPSPAGVMPKRAIQLVNVTYVFPGSDRPVLRGVNLTVPVGSRVALVGRTGSGKTTIAHAMLGLYRLSEGEILLDGVPVTAEEIPAWQANCAFVPQDIVLLDASVRENVAFSIHPDSIDDEQVWAALEDAQLIDYVASLEYGLFTIIGENGVKLSGGQRQRLALARALYRKARVLFLDEATSALDNKTEDEVMQALDLLGRRCTTIVIAHRLSTVRKCDRIFEIENGMVKASGTFDSLCETSSTFREVTRFEMGHND